MKQAHMIKALLVSLVFIIPDYAQAYIGPGASVTAIGTIIALVGAIILAIVGFIWYPLKRILSKKKEKNSKNTDSQ